MASTRSTGYTPDGLIEPRTFGEVIETLRQDELEERVLRVPNPVALDFYQATCPPCRAPRAPPGASGDRVPAPAPRLLVDIARDRSVAQRFRVKSIPTVLVLRRGREISRLDGNIREADLKAAFEQALDALERGKS